MSRIISTSCGVTRGGSSALPLHSGRERGGGIFIADTYVSQAVIKIVPQQVPTSMVQSAINQQMSDRINSMAQTILSRTTLTPSSTPSGCIPASAPACRLRNVIEQMKKKVEILPVATPTTSSDRIPAFAVQFSYEDRHLAQRVGADLEAASSMRTSAPLQRDVQTTQFIKDEMDSSKKELDDAENKLPPTACRTTAGCRISWKANAPVIRSCRRR